MKAKDKLCQKCGNCCKNYPGKYLPSDFLNVKQCLEKMLAEKTVQFDVWTHPEIFGSELKTILFPIPARKIDGSCIFLTKDNLCDIYFNRPSECRYLKNCSKSQTPISEQKKTTITLNSFVKAVETEQAYQLNYIYSWINYQDLIKRLLRKHVPKKLLKRVKKK